MSMIFTLDDEQRQRFVDKYGNDQKDLFQRHQILGHTLIGMSGMVQNPCFRPSTMKEINEYKELISTIQYNLNELKRDVEMFVLGIDNDYLEGKND